MEARVGNLLLKQRKRYDVKRPTVFLFRMIFVSTDCPVS